MTKEERQKQLFSDVKSASDEAARLLADLEDSASSQDSRKEDEVEASDSKNIYRSSHTSNQSRAFSSNIEQDSPSNPAGYVIGVAIVLGFILTVSVLNSSNNQFSGSDTSRSISESTTSGSIPYGKARYKSGRTGKTEIIGVSLSKRTNTNGHIIYDAQWADGYKSSYIFWSYGRAEIFSKNGAGNIERTNARYKVYGNGDTVITADTDAVTTFPRFDPVTN